MSRSSSWMRLVLEALLLYTIVVQNALPSAVGRVEQYQGLSSNQDLYNASDKVVILNSTNFKSNVLGSQHAWLVEFYNSWCGYCQHFAPTWKALAHNIQTWRDIVAVAAVNCIKDENYALCRDYEIMQYPEVRYFAPNDNSNTLGISIEKAKNMDGLRENLISRLQKEQQEGRGPNWPNISPIRSSEITNVWDGIPDAVKYVFYIFEDAQSFVGSEVILDLHNVTSLQIRRVSSDNTLLCISHMVTRFPTIIVFARDKSQERLSIHIPTREGIRNVIKNFMMEKGITIDDRNVPDEHPDDWLKANVPLSPDIRPKSLNEISQDSQIVNPEDDVVYQADLESALRMTLTREIPMRKMLDGNTMQALQNYTEALYLYFPLRHGNGNFLETIARVIRSKDNMTRSEYLELIKKTENDNAPVYSEENQWIKCNGTLRGYPCGLWTMFHTLTVNYAIRPDLKYHNQKPSQILRAIHGYVKYFFGCHDCVEHFVDMAARRKIFKVKSANETVLWLWRAHNEVNERLAKEYVDDPLYIKIQYPSAVHCPSCRNESGHWVESEVLTYLKRKYANSGIRYLKPRNRTEHDVPKPRHERLVLAPKNVSRKTGWDFTIFDISICVVLYVTSAAILILVCIKFAVKRSYKKKMYIHSLLGKV